MHFTQLSLKDGRAMKSKEAVFLDCIWKGATCLPETPVQEFYLRKNKVLLYYHWNLSLFIGVSLINSLLRYTPEKDKEVCRINNT